MSEKTQIRALWVLFLAILALNFGPTFASRNGAGTYTIPNSFTAGTTITASSFNQNFTDISNELTNSVAADGQTSMTGPLKASAGTAAAPSLTFAADTDSGFYRVGSNTIGVAIGGTKVAEFNSSGLDVLPPGIVSPYAGGTAPTGWLLAYGQCVSRTTYANLFAVISTTFDNSCSGTEFGIPDLRGRVAAGDDNQGGVTAGRITNAGSGMVGTSVGVVGGAQSATLGITNIPAHDHTFAATSSSNGAHTHTGTTNSHTHTGTTNNHNHSAADLLNVATLNNVATTGSTTIVYISSVSPTQTTGNSTVGFTTDGSTVGFTTDSGGAHNHTVSGTSGSTGSTTAFAIVPPTIILSYIIKH